MRKFIILVLIVSVSFNAAHSQFSVGMHVGASNKNMIAGLHSQYQFKNRFTVGLNMTTHTDNSNPAFFQSRFGYCMGNPEKLTLQPYVGYSYSIRGLEKGEQSNQLTEGLQLRYSLNRIAKVYVDFNIPTAHLYLLSIGITGRL